jgi:virginiamycin B lyase
MRPPLTVARPAQGAANRPHRTPGALVAPLLAAALLLASCGGPPAPAVTGGQGGVTSPVPTVNSLKVAADQALALIGSAEAAATLRVSSTGTVTLTVDRAPTGLTVTADTARLDGTETLIPLRVQGRATQGRATGTGSQSITVTVTSAGKSATLTLPLLTFGVRPIVLEGGGSYEASGIQFGAGGSVLLRAPASANEEGRHHLLRFDPAQNSFSLLGFGLGGFETITSHAVSPDGRVWVTVRSALSDGSVLISRDSAGNVKRYAVGATADTINSVTPTADRIWFTQYTRDRVAALNPASGEVTSYAVEENAEDLTLGAGGQLYYTRFYADPAVIGLDPLTGKTTVFKVGIPGKSLPDALTAAPDGTLWLIEARTGTVWNLNPKTGQQTQLTLPVGARPSQLAVSPDGTLWVGDPTLARLYRAQSGDTSTLTVPVLTQNGKAVGPHALAVGPDGRVWYEAAGQLVSQD